MSDDISSELLSHVQAQQYLKVSRRTIDRLAEAGKLTKIKIGYHRVMFALDDLRAFVSACRVPKKGE